MERSGKIKVLKTTFEQEQSDKDAYFLGLSPQERLQLHEELRKRIWGEKYNALSFDGLKVIKKRI